MKFLEKLDFFLCLMEKARKKKKTIIVALLILHFFFNFTSLQTVTQLHSDGHDADTQCTLCNTVSTSTNNVNVENCSFMVISESECCWDVVFLFSHGFEANYDLFCKSFCKWVRTILACSFKVDAGIIGGSIWMFPFALLSLFAKIRPLKLAFL